MKEQARQHQEFVFSYIVLYALTRGTALYGGSHGTTMAPLRNRILSASAKKPPAPRRIRRSAISIFPVSPSIPGGVHSAKDLRRALSNDDIIRARHADFQSGSARVIVLDKDRLAFVSYRIGAQVFGLHKSRYLKKAKNFLPMESILREPDAGMVSPRSTRSKSCLQP